MFRKVAIILPITFLLILSCTGRTDIPSPEPERVLSMPEKVEKEVMEVLSKDWKGLSDTVGYFYSNLLSKGKSAGKGPDGVYYELNVTLGEAFSIDMDFKVEDSVFVAVNGKTSPLEVSLHAFETEIAIRKETPDSTRVSFSKVYAVGPDYFFLECGHQAILYYEGLKVGFITMEEFENTDYSTGKYPVIHYYNDPRTFALYDK